MSESPLNRLDAVLFDLDGTLLNTLRDISEAANRALMKHGFQMHHPSAFKTFVGDGPNVLFQRAIGADSPDDPAVLELSKSYQTEASLQNDQHTTLYDGINTLLDHLTGQGIPLAILTNKLQPHAELCVAKFLGSWDWSIVLGSGSHIARKPEPAGALHIADTLGLHPSRCLYLGDTNVDMCTARRAGMQAVGVLWGFRNETELRQAGATRILHHPSELLN